MKTSSIILGTIGVLYWGASAYLAFVAWLLQILPCGFSTDTFCDEGPSLFRDALESIGPVGVLLLASAGFAAAWALNRRLQKEQ